MGQGTPLIASQQSLDAFGVEVQRPRGEPSLVSLVAYRCPLCSRSVSRSEYLAQAFARDPFGEWAANLVTHYRHDHIAYYDRTLGGRSYALANREYQSLGGNYDTFKRTVNNRAKRQLVRAVLRSKFGRDVQRGLLQGFQRLLHNDGETDRTLSTALAKVG